MTKSYKVLKKWGDFKKNEIFTPDENTDVTQEAIDALVEKGTLELVEQNPLLDYFVLADDGITFGGEDNFVVKGSVFAAEAESPEIINLLEEEKIRLATPEDFHQDDEVVADIAEVVKTKIYRGQAVVSDSPTEINGIAYHHIRLADGSAYDLNDEDYENNVVLQ